MKTMQIHWQIISILILCLVSFFLTRIYRFLKFYFVWQTSKETIPFTLNGIWKRKGIIEIQGGAETGKTLLIIALLIYLPGRKWSNVPNTVEGHKDLDLLTLKKHWMGQYKDGIVGYNNVLLIDEPWNFFSKEKLEAANLNEDDLTKLLWFASETSKTNWKIFYVKKLGIESPAPFKLLEENKTITIRTLGFRDYTNFLGRTYYYLDIEVIKNNAATDFGETEYKKDKNGKKKPKTLSWRQKRFKSNEIISIPLSSKDLEVYDASWNLEKLHAMNKEISKYKKMGADVLIEMTKTGQSRRQKKRIEEEAVAAWRKYDKNRRNQMINKGRQVAKERGLYKTAEEDIAADEAKLQELLENGEITLEEAKEKAAKINERWQKLSEATDKTYPTMFEGGGKNTTPNPPWEKNKKKPPFAEEREEE
jgi:hypothetical protein